MDTASQMIDNFTNQVLIPNLTQAMIFVGIVSVFFVILEGITKRKK